MKLKQKWFSFRVTQDFKNALDKLSEARDQSRTSIIEEILTREFKSCGIKLDQPKNINELQELN